MSPAACHASASQPNTPSLVSLFDIRWQGLVAQSHNDAGTHALSLSQSLAQSRESYMNERQDALPREATLPLGRLVQGKSQQPPLSQCHLLSQSSSQGLKVETVAVEQQQQQQQQQQPRCRRSQAMGCVPSRLAIECCLSAGARPVKGSANIESSGKAASPSGLQSGSDNLFSMSLHSTHHLCYRVSQKREQERLVTVAGDITCGFSACPSKPIREPFRSDSLQAAALEASAPASSLLTHCAAAPPRVHEMPDELLRQIFSRLSVSDFPRVAAVCHQWHTLALDPSLWSAAFCRCHCLLSLGLPPSTASLPAMLAAHAAAAGGPAGAAAAVDADADGGAGCTNAAAGVAAGCAAVGAEARENPGKCVALGHSAAVARASAVAPTAAEAAWPSPATAALEAKGSYTHITSTHRRDPHYAAAVSVQGIADSHARRHRNSALLCPPPSSSPPALTGRRCFLSVFSLLASPEFALSHPIARTDSVASLAVRFHVQAMDIRRLNNIMSDHAIHTRTRLLIPIPSCRRPVELPGRHCAVQFDCHARREVLLVFREGEEGEIQRAYGETQRGRPSAARGTAQVVSLLQRALQVDEATARYYLGESVGDVRAAVALFMEDQQWERAQAHAGERRSLANGGGRGKGWGMARG
ncbi:hypothetical protein CLOM_g2579 [Closterium sp. NIES-68]|nr:hypothetical protein CLOM_g2579 [Closterium sp. NIES-68]GJP77046.1 hypothetical protein CLOP_g7479 [Closterium sp. NIES-67]